MNMTQLQKSIYDYILNNQPICDKCIASGLGYTHNQNANQPCRKLNKLNYISRTKGHCDRCNSIKLLNRIIK